MDTSAPPVSPPSLPNVQGPSFPQDPTNAQEPPGESEVFLTTLRELLGNRPATLTDLHAAEESVRQVYSDRFVFELLQNARDAAALAGTQEPRVLFVLQSDALLIANDGAPFTLRGVEGVKGFGKSPKPADAANRPHQPRLIGRKGIGFKSVLQVSRRPAIFGRTASNRRIALEFGHDRVRQLCRAAAMGDLPSGALRALAQHERDWLQEFLRNSPIEHSSMVSGMKERGAMSVDELESQLPIMRLPLWAANVPHEVDGLLGWDGCTGRAYQTVVRLALDPTHVDDVRRRLREDVVPEKILFLGTLSHIEVRDDTTETRWKIEARWSTDRSRVTLHQSVGEQSASTTYALFTRTVVIPIESGGTEEREVRAALPLADGKLTVLPERQHLFTFYPLSDEGRFFPFLVHAEFEPDPGRTKLSADHQSLNGRLLEEVAGLVAGPPGSGSIRQAIIAGDLVGRSLMPDLLVPGASERPAVAALRAKVLDHLRAELCVPREGGWSRPGEVLNAADQRELLLPFEREFAAVGLHLPSRDWYGEARVLHELGANPYEKTHLVQLLASGCTAHWGGDVLIEKFRRLFALMAKTAPTILERTFLLEAFRPGGVHAGVPLLPCPSPQGLTVNPLPLRRRIGAPSQEERQSIRVFLPLADLEQEAPVPPDDLRVRFLDQRLLTPGNGSEPLDRSFAEQALDVRPFDTDAVIQRLALLDASALSGESRRVLARFMLAFLVSLPRENPDRRAFLDRAKHRHTPEPARHAAPYRSAADWNQRLAALSRVWLPTNGGQPKSASSLRFTVRWGSAHSTLDRLDPPSVDALADPIALADYLDAATAARFLVDDDRAALVGQSDASYETVGAALAWGFARAAGVWETVPVELVESAVKNLGSHGPLALSYADHLRKAGYLKFGQTLNHQKAVVTTTRIARLADMTGDGDRRRALAELLVRDWDGFFKPLLWDQIECAGCFFEGTSSKHTVTRQGTARSLLWWQILHESWYSDTVDAEAVAPDGVWLVPGEENRETGVFKFIHYVAPATTAERDLLRNIGVPEFDDAPPQKYAELLTTLGDLEIPRGNDARLLLALHHRIYRHLSRHYAMHDKEWISLAEVFSSLKLLAHKDGKLIHATPSETVLDLGAHSQARTLFRRNLAFLSIDDSSPELFRLLGAQPFEVAYQVERQNERNADEEVAKALSPWLPALLVISWRITPGGGTPLDPDGDNARERLRQFREAEKLECEGLRVTCSVVGRLDIPPQRVEAAGTTRAYLHEFPDKTDSGRKTVRRQLLIPAAWWNGGTLDEERLRALAPELARLLATPSHEDVFARLLAVDSEEVDSFIEARGLSAEDLAEARRRLALGDGEDTERIVLAWQALLEAWPDRAEANALANAESGCTWSAILEHAQNAGLPLADVSARLAPSLLQHESLKRRGSSSPLGEIQTAGFDLRVLSHSLSSRTLGSIRFHELPDLLARWAHSGGPLLEAAFHLAGRALEDASRAAGAALECPVTLPFDALTTADELAALVQKRLEEAGLRGAPRPDASLDVQRAALAASVGVDPAVLENTVQQLRNPDQHRVALQKELNDRLSAWLPVLVALTLKPSQHDSAATRAFAAQCAKEIRHGFPMAIDARSPFRAWIVSGASLVPELADATLDALERGTAPASLTSVLQRPDLVAEAERVRRVLDDAITRRRDELQRNWAQFADVSNPRSVDPATGGAPRLPDKIAPYDKTIRRGHAGDKAAQRAQDRLGRLGENIAAAWVLRTLRARAQDQATFPTLVSRLRSKLNQFTLDVELAAHFDAAARDLGRAELAVDEFLDAASQLCHVSRISDAFGFDLLGLDAKNEPLLLEVKTSRALEDPFHLSGWQQQVATAAGSGYAVLRVLIPLGSAPQLVLLVDPIKLVASGQLIADPESFEMTLSDSQVVSSASA